MNHSFIFGTMSLTRWKTLSFVKVMMKAHDF